MKDIYIKGLAQNNLKNISLTIQKEKITVFTGLSGSGKSSIVFDTIAADSQKQMNETYPAFVRSRMPKHQQPNVELLQNLTPSVVVDQSPLGGNARSTVGTSSELYTMLRLLFSRIGQPYIGAASCFSFNDPNGMCPHCSGIGKTAVIDMTVLLDMEKSWNQGCVRDSTYQPETWYWRQYSESGLFDLDKPIKEYSSEEYNLLLYGSRNEKGEQEHPKVDGLYHKYSRTYLNRDISGMSKIMQLKAQQFIKEAECSVCHGKRLNQSALSCKIMGYSIADFSEIELEELKEVLSKLDNRQVETLVHSLKNGLQRMIDIGLSYLNLGRETSTLSGGEAQRLKLVKYMGSSLSGMTYIFDEPSTGLHPRDVYRMNNLLKELRDNGNTVLVVEHDPDVIQVADEIVDVGPYAGENGGEIVFQGNYQSMLQADTLTAKALKMNLPLNQHPRQIKEVLTISNANLHNLKSVNVDIPLNMLTVVTGVAGSGKSTLITEVLTNQHRDKVVLVNQGPITATNRSMPASFLGFFDEIRKLFAKENAVSESMFSFNSDGACPVCKGKGVVVTELVYMDPVVNECEVCKGTRYSEQVNSFELHGKNIIEVLSLTVSEALLFFKEIKIRKVLKSMEDVGLAYLSLGQPLSTLSGGERQRIKLAKYLGKKGNIFILDEPTTGLHRSDTEKLIKLFNRMIEKGNSVIIIEHNLDVVKQADWIIDVGPDGGKNGGRIVFEGTPKEMAEEGRTITSECLRKSLKWE